MELEGKSVCKNSIFKPKKAQSRSFFSFFLNDYSEEEEEEEEDKEEYENEDETKESLISKFSYENSKNSSSSSSSLHNEEEGEEEEFISFSFDSDDDYFYLTDTKKLMIIFSIASGMSYLHSHNIIHRDLKPYNIYLDKYDYVNISGFSIAKEIEGGDVIKPNKKIKGTPAYIAPEVYLNKGYSKAGDVYSFALIMYELFTDEKPYSELKSPREIKKYIVEDNKRPIFKNPIEKCYQQLIERCWSSDPKLRPTFDEIVNELKNNPSFITEKVDKKVYAKFIEYIEESEKTFNTSKKINQLEEYVKFNLYKFEKNKSKINLKNNYETETNNVFLDYDFINIDKYVKEKIFLKKEDYNLYLIKDKQTENQLYFAQQYNGRPNENKLIKLLNNIIGLKHPSLLNFIGYSPINFKNEQNPVILREFASNGSLSRMIEIEKRNKHDSVLDETIKLICIYGIAAGLSYLHSNGLIYCKLEPSNIFLDDFLFPKIPIFEKIHKASKNTVDDFVDISNKDLYYYDDKIYESPEIRKYDEYSAAGDIYSFGMIIYYIIMEEKPFFIDKSFNTNSYYEVLPRIKETTPKCYRDLIEKCWKLNPKERPTIDEIIYNLKNNPEFITDKVNKEEYFNYINYIEKAQDIFKNKAEVLLFNDYIESQNQSFRKVKIDFNKMRDWARQRFTVNMKSIDINVFEKVKKIGAGSFGSVYKVINKKTDEICAAKVSIYEIDQCSDDVIINLSREIEIISSLNHPAILQFIGYSPYNLKNKPKPNNIPFEGLNQYQLMCKLLSDICLDNFFPELEQYIPYCFKVLIKACWERYSDDRPSFDKIVENLENDPSFISKSVNKEEYYNYIAYIKSMQQNIFIKEETQKNNFPINDRKIEISNDLKIIKENEDGNNDSYLDLNKFERKNVINKGDDFKICEICEKETGDVFAAQISMMKVDKLSEAETVNLSLEIEKFSQMKHPSLLKFIGYSPIDFKKENKPVIIMELTSNGTLADILELERNNKSISEFDSTKKLINIYGIAAGMSYLHSLNIVHRCLKPSNIYLDETLFPKIGDFGLSTRFFKQDLLTHQSISGNKGTPIYSSPEILQYNEYSKMSDVYAFGFIVYEIMLTERPFNEISNINQIIDEVVIKNKRPKFKKEIPDCYRELIEKCWDQNPNERPTFDDILYYLKVDQRFITDNIRKEDFHKFIKFIDSQETHLNSEKYEENNSDEQSLIIDNLIQSNDSKELIKLLNEKCDVETTISVFDKCYQKSKEFYLNLCKEGILINNPIAHHKYSVFLIFDETEKDLTENYKKARNHLEISTNQGFLLSYFLYSRLCYEVFKENDKAFSLAKEGTEKGDKYSKCLLGFFIANGIGTKKDFKKGISIIIDSKAEDFYESFATSIGIYYSKFKSEEKKAFFWFEKAKEIFEIGALKNDVFSLYHLAYIIEETDPKQSLILYEKSANQGFIYAKSKYSSLMLKIDYKYKLEESQSHYDTEAQSPIGDFIDEKDQIFLLKNNTKTKENIKTQEFLVKKYSKENDTENTYKYILSLIKSRNFSVPLEYAINLYNLKHYKQAFLLFNHISSFNHPIAKYFIGLMKYKGQFCIEDKKEAFEIMKELSNNGIDRASQFLEDYFK